MKENENIKSIKVLIEKNGLLIEREYSDVINWNYTETEKDDYTSYTLSVEGLKIKE